MRNKVIFSEEIESGIFNLCINDKYNRNVITEQLYDDILSEFINLKQSKQIKVLIISGYSKVFCGGGSLDFLNKLANFSASERNLHNLFNEILTFPVPIIAAMQGHAVGGGLALGLYCDILIASTRSRYGFNFTNMGFTPGLGITKLLPVLAGPHLANEMILTGKMYYGHELKSSAIFNAVVEPEHVEQIALDHARRISEKPAHVLRMLKEQLTSFKLNLLNDAKQIESLMQNVCFQDLNTQNIINDSYIKVTESVDGKK